MSLSLVSSLPSHELLGKFACPAPKRTPKGIFLSFFWIVFFCFFHPVESLFDAAEPTPRSTKEILVLRAEWQGLPWHVARGRPCQGAHAADTWGNSPAQSVLIQQPQQQQHRDGLWPMPLPPTLPARDVACNLLEANLNGDSAWTRKHTQSSERDGWIGTCRDVVQSFLDLRNAFSV